MPRDDGLKVVGLSEMRARIRAFDWSKTPLGPISTWPETLKTAVQIMLDSRYPMFVWWGTELTNLYNDHHVAVHGKRHPQALGKSARNVWAEVWDILGPQTDAVLVEGNSTWNEEILLPLERNGFPEETYFTFSYSPVRDGKGSVLGLFGVCTEDTSRVLARRRLKILRDLGERTLQESKSVEEAVHAAAAVLGDNPLDTPFALTYLLDRDGRTGKLAACSAQDLSAAPTEVTLASESDIFDFHSVLRNRAIEKIHDFSTRLRQFAGEAWPEPIENAVVVPLAKTGIQEFPAGFLVAGISPRLNFDADYRSFLELAGGQIAIAIANARAYEDERERAEALAELDRAKTTFFSNISHEFRTPLTLMLGPLETLLAKDGALGADDRSEVETAHRNSLRLLKLVNSLLDFSRTEAGRLKASYEPVDLAALTADLASNFRSAMEAAGLELRIHCSPVSQPVYIDRDMWEKIVLNLLSNAFKFTFKGNVGVRVEERDGHAVLTISDTGVGIPEAELPHIFERFHRVEGVKGRTFEGSGIGLALVQELVRLHGGSIEVESHPGTGSAFTIVLPFGDAHLPKERLREPASKISTAVRAEAFTGEAMSWLAHDRLVQPSEGLPFRYSNETAAARTRILIADDNSDMREHLSRILNGNYEITAVEDGGAALRAARENRPDLVLADVMMPGLDGFGLLHEMREDEQLRDIPVILVSARAGEEARIEGIDAGADDYITKPFNARELLARVRTTLDLRRGRREADEAIKALNTKLSFDLATMTRLQGQLARELEDTEKLQRISGLLIESQEGHGLYGQILDTAMSIMRADFGSIQMFDTERGKLNLIAWRNFHPEAARFWQNISRETGTSCGSALRHGERVIIPDVHTADFLSAETMQYFLLSGIAAVQSTPLTTREGRIIGMLSTHWREVHSPAQREFRLLDILARQAADFFDRSGTQEALQSSLVEKEELLKEVHHRVKNNLQVITSLLNMQARQIDNPDVLTQFDEARNRVFSIAAIHDLLYRSTSFSAINLADYARQLVPDLVHFYDAQDRIQTTVIGNGATLELERAVPYGLLLNELVSNACKHGFPSPRRGSIMVSFHRKGGYTEMTVTDDGQGLPEGFDYRRDGSLGLKLVRSLARQLRGTAEVQSGSGMTVRVRFPEKVQTNDA